MNDSSRGLPLRRIVSGGQTGVDRGALDAAIAAGVAHGGWCPHRRLAENGRIPRKYRLKETSSPDYWVRTEQNVIDSCGTLILYCGQLSGGTELTYRMAVKHGRPHLLVDVLEAVDPASIRAWITEHAIEVLNVAGPRESSVPGIGQEAERLVREVLAGPE